MSKAGTIAAAAGVGLAAGLAGTAAMTASSTIEMKLRGRAGSSTAADAAGKVLGVQPRSERFATLAHWGYGTGWGAIRGVLGSLGLSAPTATAAHLAMVWGTEQIMLPALKVSPPATQWGGKELAIDAWHHLVYAGATGAAYELLDR